MGHLPQLKNFLVCFKKIVGFFKYKINNMNVDIRKIPISLNMKSWLPIIAIVDKNTIIDDKKSKNISLIIENILLKILLANK